MCCAAVVAFFNGGLEQQNKRLDNRRSIRQLNTWTKNILKAEHLLCRDTFFQVQLLSRTRLLMELGPAQVQAGQQQQQFYVEYDLQVGVLHLYCVHCTHAY